ncbi:FliH/SctL family protein [Limnobacter humi]|uniref:Flagellar assembly protein FliH n=1 Tax=Limnobacter humi TaxID=1778671 RepID=A0ABT1WK87_9BURK|nr:FliH/SctL family protein [Limnobacter humi]MCQ8897516.1 FliH/SctL family protein [Limnobacter humi]
MLLSKRIVKGVETATPWKALAPDSNNPIGDLLAHKALIKQREEDIIRKAQALRQKEHDVEQVVHQSREQGYEDGHREGYNDGLKLANEEAARLAQVCVQLQAELSAIQNRLAERMLDLVVVSARQVVQDHTVRCPESIAALLKAAIQSISADVVYITVAAAPATIANMQYHLQALGPLSTQVQQSVAVNFKEDPRLAEGGFMVYHTAGQMDYSLETRWRNVFSALSDQPEHLHHAQPG